VQKHPAGTSHADAFANRIIAKPRAETITMSAYAYASLRIC
jgi:hypothetical protein